MPKFQSKTVVWAKLDEFPYWPAIVGLPSHTDELTTFYNKPGLAVLFFGKEKEWGLVSFDFIQPFTVNLHKYSSNDFKLKEAVDEALLYSQNNDFFDNFHYPTLDLSFKKKVSKKKSVSLDKSRSVSEKRKSVKRMSVSKSENLNSSILKSHKIVEMFQKQEEKDLFVGNKRENSKESVKLPINENKPVEKTVIVDTSVSQENSDLGKSVHATHSHDNTQNHNSDYSSFISDAVQNCKSVNAAQVQEDKFDIKSIDGLSSNESKKESVLENSSYDVTRSHNVKKERVLQDVPVNSKDILEKNPDKNMKVKPMEVLSTTDLKKELVSNDLQMENKKEIIPESKMNDCDYVSKKIKTENETFLSTNNVEGNLISQQAIKDATPHLFASINNSIGETKQNVNGASENRKNISNQTINKPAVQHSIMEKSLTSTETILNESVNNDQIRNVLEPQQSSVQKDSTASISESIIDVSVQNNQITNESNLKQPIVHDNIIGTVSESNVGVLIQSNQTNVDSNLKQPIVHDNIIGTVSGSNVGVLIEGNQTNVESNLKQPNASEIDKLISQSGMQSTLLDSDIKKNNGILSEIQTSQDTNEYKPNDKHDLKDNDISIQTEGNSIVDKNENLK